MAHQTATRKRIGPGLRKSLFQEQFGRCYYCKRPMVMPGDGPTGPTTCSVDHVIPRLRGGSDDPSNLVACCRQCNTAKGNSVLTPAMIRRREKRGPKKSALQKPITRPTEREQKQETLEELAKARRDMGRRIHELCSILSGMSKANPDRTVFLKEMEKLRADSAELMRRRRKIMGTD